MNQFELDRENEKTDLPNNEDLHAVAGLIDVGLDEDGNVEWCGTKKQWNKYEELVLTNK